MKQLLLGDQDVEHRADADQRFLLRPLEGDLRRPYRRGERADRWHAPPASCDHDWVAVCTAARRASSTWLRRCPTVCSACRVCE